jgi:hypothetical protein
MQSSIPEPRRPVRLARSARPTRVRNRGHSVSRATRITGRPKSAKYWQMAICRLAHGVHFAQPLRHDAIGRSRKEMTPWMPGWVWR